MSINILSACWIFSGIAVFLVLLTIYARVEGKRMSGTHLAHRDWWWALSIAMGWQKRELARASRRSNVVMIDGFRRDHRADQRASR